MPVDDIDLPLFPYADKVAHTFMFMFLSFIFCRALTGPFRHQVEMHRYKKFIFAAVILTALYSSLMESIHYFIGERSFELFDLGANFVGAFLGAPLTVPYRMVRNAALRKVRKS